MDYTLSPDYATHAGTGNRMHEENAAVTTVWSEKDANSVIWSLMEVVKAAGLEGVQFDEATPATYQKLLTALRSAGVFITPAQFDASTKAATMAAVQRALGGIRGYQGYNVSAALTVAEVGKLIEFSGSTAAQILTLPALGGLTDGAGIPFKNVATVPVTLKGDAAEPIVACGIGTGSTSANTLILGVGESTYLIKAGATWTEQQGVRSGSINFLGSSGQSWQNLAASRAVQVLYTNTTGRPIMVCAGGTATGAEGYYTFNVNGVALVQVTVAAGSRFSLSGVVPPGGTYILSKGGGDTFTSILWAELR